jgi:glycosyltransferase involved in cell wall biosynthesis
VIDDTGAGTSPGRSSTWSLAMIVRDEEGSIAQVLDDASSFCDERVVVDTGSKDGTIEIARAHGATVHSFEWIDDFSAARNFSFDLCRGDWIVWLDADDRVPPAAQAGFRRLRRELESRSDLDGVMVPYHRVFDAEDPAICTFSFDRERVLRREAALRWTGPVHEVIALPTGRWTRWTEAWVEHRPAPGSWTGKRDRNLRILERAVNAGDRSPRSLFYYANELRDHRRFEESLAVYSEYVDRSDVEWERYAAFLHMADCASGLGRDDDRMKFLVQAMMLDSTRAEAFNRIGVHFYERREWRRAIPFFAAAAALDRPADGFVSDPDYTWLPQDYLAICLNACDKPEEALEYTVRALKSAPAASRERLMGNIRFYVDRVSQRERP